MIKVFKQILIGLVLSIKLIEANSNLAGNGTLIQKINFENSLIQRMSQFVKVKYPELSFYIEVDTKLKDAAYRPPTLPEYSESNNQQSNEIISNKESDVKGTQLIVMDRFGLSHPTLNPKGKKNERGKIDIELFNTQKKIEFELANKSNLINLIESIEIKMALDAKVNPVIKDGILSDLQKLFPNINGIEIKFETIDVEMIRKEAEVVEEKSILTKYIPEMILAGSFLLATFIFSLFLVKSFREVGGAVNDLKSNSPSENIPIKSETDVMDTSMRPGSAALTDAIMSVNNGLEKMTLFVEKSPSEASRVILRWIQNGDYLSIAALNRVSQALSIEELSTIMQQFDEEACAQWQNYASNENIDYSHQEIDKFIAQSIFEDFAATTLPLGKELEKVLAKVDENLLLNLLQKKSKYTSTLLNVVNSRVVSKALNLVNEKDLNFFLEEGTKFTIKDLKKDENGFLNFLLENLNQKEMNPFLRNLSTFYINLTAINQDMAFLKSLKSFGPKYAENLAKGQIPGVVIFGSSDHNLKNIFKLCSREKLINYFSYLELDERNRYLDVIGKEGSKVRDTLNFEIEHVDQSGLTKTSCYEELVGNIQHKLKSEHELSSLLIKEYFAEVKELPHETPELRVVS